MAINPNNLLGQSNPNGTVGVSLGIDPAGANEAFSAGVTSGFVVRPNSPAGMTVKVGGESGVVDSALVRSPAGITFPVGNVSGTAIELSVPAAPSTNSRIDSVVLYVDTSVEVTETDGADALGMEIVSGTSASTPVPPTDQQIRTAIEDGASIAYVVIANITVASGATTITQSDIENTNRSTLGASKVDFATIRLGQNGSYTLSNTTGTKYALPFNVVRENVGNGFSASNNGILVGSGVNRVIISGSLYYFTGTGGPTNGMLITQNITKNGNSVSTVNGRFPANYQVRPFPAICIPVTEGDIIRVEISKSDAGTATFADPEANTFLQAIAIG